MKNIIADKKQLDLLTFPKKFQKVSKKKIYKMFSYQ